MHLLSVAALLLHVFVLYNGVMFFRTGDRVRDQDRHVVATTMVGSILVIGAQITDTVSTNEVLSPWNVAFAVFNAMLYLALIKGYVQVRSCGRRDETN